LRSWPTVKGGANDGCIAASAGESKREEKRSTFDLELPTAF